MMTSLSLIFPLVDQWHQLRDGTRDAIIGGLVVAVVISAAGLFHRSLLAGLRRLVGGNPSQPPQSSPHEIILKLEGARPIESPPPQAPAVPISQSPDIPRPPIAGFVARRDKNGHDIVARLKEELAPEKDQLIVLWGAGGVGKTTLAAEAARLLREDFPGGIIWISAEGRSDFSLSTLLDEIATHLGRVDLRQLLLERKDAEVHDALASSPPVLIVLDNFETVSSAEQDKCAEWLAKRANCPALITSRDEAVHARPINILAMSLAEAREFLNNLLGQVRNSKAFDGLDHEEIIRASDRIPLVLQWVVKRIDSAKQPQAVLDDLAHGEGDAAKRVFDRSFDLPQVGDDGRAVLLALSLFVPSASRAALAEVAGLGDDTQRLDPAVQQLAELWLVETTAGNERLRVEGLTRALAKARLTKEKLADEFQRRFLTYFLRYSEVHGQPTPENFDLLEVEKDNIFNSMDIGFSLAEWTSIIRVMDAISYDGVNGYLPVRGYWNEAIRRGQQALEAATNLSDDEKIAHFSHNLAIRYAERGEMAEARRLYADALQIMKGPGNENWIAISLHELAILAQDQGDFKEARRLYNESLEIKKKLGDQSGIAKSLHQLARLAQDQGEIDEARRLYHESLEIAKKLGDQRVIAASLHNLATLAKDQGETDEARRLYQESLEIKKKLGDQGGIATSLGQLGRLAETEGNDVEAARLFEEALRIFETLKSPYAETARKDLERVKGKSS